MYHIKNDKRAKTSASLVVDALNRYLKSQKYEDLTITELCNISTVSRATFYRLFDSIEDVVAYSCELFAEEITAKVNGLESDKIIETFFQEWMQNEELLHLVLKIGRTDILYECHRKRMDLLQDKFLKLDDNRVISDYHLSVLTSVMIDVLLTWERHKKKENAKELQMTLKQVLSDMGSIFS